SSRRRHTRFSRDWSSDVCSSDLDGSSAKCEATEAAPDLSLDVRELGAAYLGGTTLQTLASAGLVAEHQPGSLAATSLAFGWHRRSEERRVGKEGRSRWSQQYQNK